MVCHDNERNIPEIRLNITMPVYLYKEYPENKTFLIILVLVIFYD